MENTMDREQFLTNYWTYFLMIENKLLTTRNYVEFTTENYSTYSNEYAALLQTIGSELDSFFKVYCGYPLVERKNIKDYADHLLNSEPELTAIDLLFSETRLSLTPFLNWDLSYPACSLVWWQAYIDIKHSRAINFSSASLENVINCLGALFIMETRYLIKISDITKEPDIPNEESRLFKYKISPFKVQSCKELYMFPD